MPIPGALMLALKAAPTMYAGYKALKSGGGGGLSDTDKNIKGRLSSIIGQGGFGLSDEQMGQRKKWMKGQMQPEIRRAELNSDIDATNRGIYDSPLAAGQKAVTRQNANSKLADALQQLEFGNQQTKQNSLMQALQMQAGYGDIERQQKLNNQMAWAGLFEVGLDELLDLGGD